MKRLMFAFSVLGVFAAGSSAVAGTIDMTNQITLPASATTTNSKAQSVPLTAMAFTPTARGTLTLSFDSNTWSSTNSIGGWSSSGTQSPEPTALLMLGTGLVGLAAMVRHKWFKE